MRALSAGNRMQLRFDLQRHTDAGRFLRVSGPGLGSWNQAAPGSGCPTCRFALRVTSDVATPEPGSGALVMGGLVLAVMMRCKLTGGRWRTKRASPSE